MFKTIVEALLAGGKYVPGVNFKYMYSHFSFWGECLVLVGIESIFMFYIAIACWNSTQQGLLVKTYSTCSSLPDAKNVYF